MKIHYLNLQGTERMFENIVHLQNMDSGMFEALFDNSKSVTLAVDRIEGIFDQKAIQRKAVYGNYNPDADCHYLECAVCKETIGQLDNEDADGKYKYNIFGNYCPNCGQKIVQKYTEEDYKQWGV